MEIALYNREEEKIEQEIVFEQRFMNLFYGTRVGLMITSVFIKRRWFSRLYGSFQDKASSRKKIPEFIEKYKIEMEDYQIPIDGFSTFNEFFVRKIKPDQRPIDVNPSHFISPADSRVLIQKVEGETIIPVKGRKVLLKKLLSDSFDYTMFKGGVCLVFRLAPSDYHRFCHVDSGKQSKVKKVKGAFHSVSPYALRANQKVFDGNYREICAIVTENFGKLLHIDVGALTVGKIIQTNEKEGKVKRGDEKGYFQFGASTVIIMIQKDQVNFDKDILKYSEQGIETRVRMGEKIGVKNKL